MAGRRLDRSGEEMTDVSGSIGVRDINPERELEWARKLLDDSLGGRWQARRGELLDVLALPGLVAEVDGRPAGLLCYRLDGEGCELAAIAVTIPRAGIGRALVAALRDRVPGRSIWVVTTNDNLDALRFYQRFGFRLRTLRAGAVDESRQT